MKLLIANGHLMDPATGQNSGKNLLIENGKVAAWLDLNDQAPADAEIFDARGLVVAPGFIDMHVHLREPGHEHKETIATGWVRPRPAVGQAFVQCQTPIRSTTMQRSLAT